MRIPDGKRIDLEDLFDLFARVGSTDATDKRMVESREITKDDVDAFNTFKEFYKTLFKRLHLDHWPIITREQSTSLVRYLDRFFVIYTDTDRGLGITYCDERGYDTTPSIKYFIIDDTFKCTKCGIVVPLFEKLCEKCSREKEMASWCPAI